MRETKFRCWNKETKVLVEPATLQNICKFAIMAGREMGNEIKIMQYTGLEDKNGKEIYEGDKIKTANGSEFDVQFLNGGFYLCNGQAFFLNDWLRDCEVIGNIYENPELLK